MLTAGETAICNTGCVVRLQDLSDTLRASPLSWLPCCNLIVRPSRICLDVHNLVPSQGLKPFRKAARTVRTHPPDPA